MRWVGTVVGAVLVVGLMVVGGVALLTTGGSERGATSGAPSQVTGTMDFKKNERRASVSVPETWDSEVAVTAQLTGAPVKGLSVRAGTPKDGQFRIVLSRAAQAPVTVRWTAAGGEVVTAESRRDLSPMIGFVAFGVGLVLAAFLLSQRTPTGAVMFAAYAKVAGLLVAAGIGLVAAVIGSDSENPDGFTALFTLLGLIAGYLAGTRTEPQDGEEERPANGPKTSGGEGSGTPVPPAPEPGSPQISRQLL